MLQKLAGHEKDLGGGVGLSIGSLYLRDFR